MKDKLLPGCLLFLFLASIASSFPIRDKRAFSYIANQTVCVVDSVVYHDGDPIPTDDPCESCKCRPPGFSCVLRECEVKPGCKAIRRDGECCPEYQCGCEHNGKFFNDGDRIPNAESPCYSCYCQGSSITCALADCKFRFDCEPEYVPGECCPRYDHCPPDPSVSTTTLASSTLSSFFTTLPPPPTSPVVLNVTVDAPLTSTRATVVTELPTTVAGTTSTAEPFTTIVSSSEAPSDPEVEALAVTTTIPTPSAAAKGESVVVAALEVTTAQAVAEEPVQTEVASVVAPEAKATTIAPSSSDSITDSPLVVVAEETLVKEAAEDALGNEIPQTTSPLEIVPVTQVADITTIVPSSSASSSVSSMQINDIVEMSDNEVATSSVSPIEKLTTLSPAEESRLATGSLVEESYETTTAWVPATSLSAEHRELADFTITTQIPPIEADELDVITTTLASAKRNVTSGQVAHETITSSSSTAGLPVTLLPTIVVAETTLPPASSENEVAINEEVVPVAAAADEANLIDIEINEKQPTNSISTTISPAL